MSRNAPLACTQFQAWHSFLDSAQRLACGYSVSYTHLDVYKRQERRSTMTQLSRTLRRELNEAQIDTLAGLERFGWELKFIRKPLFKDCLLYTSRCV